MIWAFKLAIAGMGAMIWHWGLGVGLIILCILFEMFAGMIPVFGPFLDRFRKDALWVAAGIAVALCAYTVGVRDEAARCFAKEQIVRGQVLDAASPAKQPHKDKWETDQ